jgi:hypothetical protein
MITINELKLRLASIEYHPNVFMGREIKDLSRILTPTENIVQCINGHYNDGLALFVATDQRLLIIDHKPMFLNVDSLTYSMIQEITYSYRLLNTTIEVYTASKTLKFSSMNHSGMRSISDYIQKQINAYKSYSIESTNMLARQNPVSPMPVGRYNKYPN